ncbi:Transposase OS=Candidatus Contendobacter odensis Run_B_J11 GN=BN874_1700002 PE=4 SV=1 [Gemmata massiliana]|uniref:Transposase n=1 Tax=Gemmata massiliana TaxID=1210884 RepID=A0A6P2D0R3_9BACT|nr:Transposase OS=Candidatus Contendobacter odensis Run_B_J11 GN=BN874_1700002 PE=4 SV=1 [Gemmata massiliana]
MCRKHQISPSLFALWKATFLQRLPVLFQADEQRSADAARVADLERLVGQQALELAALKKASTWPGRATPNGGRS